MRIGRGGTVAASIALAVIGLAGDRPETATGPLVEGIRAYDQRADPERSMEAVEWFDAAAEADPGSYEARWRGAQARYYLGTFATPDMPRSEKLALFQGGIDLTLEAKRLRPDGAEGHFWLGVMYGVYGETRGILKSLSMVSDVREQLRRSLELDPAVEGHGPDRALGRMYFRLPWFKGGDNKRSREHLERSVRGTPTHPLTRLYLAETYKALGERDQAVEQLRHVVSMVPDPRWRAEHPFIVEDAHRLLRKLE